MTTKISTNNLDSTVTTLISQGGGPKITNVFVTDSSYTNLDDTAVDTAGGYIKITGTGFASGCQVLINTTAATSVTFISTTEIRAQLPATAAGTYVVYVVNTDGGVAIRFNGVTFSGTPTWSTSSALSGSATDSAISIQLTATGDTPMTYALQAGSSLPAGLTLNSSGLLSGTVAGLNNDTTYNFTVVATDAQLQDSPRAFSITITSGDPSWSYVTTLLNADVTPFNSDASSNAFAVTVVGDTRPNNFGPYTPGYYSNFFDGTGDYLSLASSSAFNFGAANFTVEAWYYFTALPGSGTNDTLYTFGNYNPYLYLWGDGTIILRSAQTSGDIINVAHGFTVGQWYHLALVKTGTSFVLYRNGSVLGSGTSSAIVSENKSLEIGGQSTFGFTGYMSNFRTVNGTAVYTSAFTPPTTPLTAITNTSLLTCQSNRFIDNSTNAFTVTRNGDTLISGFDPFVPASDTATFGSAYFDGTGDYLTTSSNSAQFGTGDFTIEFWIYLSSLPAAVAIIDFRASNGVSFGQIYINTDRTVHFYLPTDIATTNTLTFNAWNHVAISRGSGTLRMFINGVSGFSGSDSATYNAGAVTIGGAVGGTSLMTGYLSNVRFVIGTAVYTSAFTPPTAPLTAIANTSLLTCQTNQPNNNNMFLDSSTNNFLVTRNGNTTQGTFSPYGPLWSNYFDGNGDSLSYTGGSSLAFGTSDFTIELWVYMTNTGTFSAFLRPDDNGTFPEFGYDWSATQLKFQARDNAFAVAVTTTAVVVNAWNHIAVSRSGTSLRLFVNGSQVGSTTTNSTNFGTTTGAIRIGGSSFSVSHSVNGYISNFRVVKGTALYTANFTPSTSPLTAIANTSLLTCTDNRLIDDSPNNFTIARNGDVSVQRFSPFSPQTVTTFYSANFTVKSQFLSIPATSSLITFASDFTFEAWIYPTDTSIIYWGLWDSRQAGATAQAMIFNIDPLASPVSGQGRMMYYNGSYHYGTSTVNYNTWTHVAWVRSGTTMTFYVNGVAGGTATVSGTQTGTATSNPVYIGSKDSGLAGYGLVGYISNFRIVNGTAVYTSNFTPSTQPLTAIANTSLLTCQSATFIDNSTNNFTITAGGVVAPSTVSPFTPTATTGVSYSPSVYGGSMYLDGTGDWLTTPSNAAFNFTANFTVEAWLYPTNLTGARQIASTRASSSTATSTAWSLGLNGSALAWFTTAYNISGGTLNVNAWNHVAAARVGSTLTLYLNGISIGTATLSNNFTDQQLAIGACINGTEPFIGYISNLRVLRSSAAYTSNFAPPVSPLTAVQNNVLLLNGTSAGVYDMSMMNNYETVGNSSLVTNIKKYGNSSLYFDGDGDYIIAPASQNYDFGNGNWTIECWVYFNNVSNAAHIWQFGANSGSRTNIYLSGSKIALWSGSAVITGTTTVITGTWYHIAVSFSASNTTSRLFLNGVSEGTNTSFNSHPKNASDIRFMVGWQPYGGVSGDLLNGYVDDLRITKGVARYTTTFTPPSGAFGGK